MEDIAKIQTLVGESITKEDLCYVDCYVHHHMGLFIPSVGFCQYAIQEGHTHPAYMIIIAFEPQTFEELTALSVPVILRKDHFFATILSPDIPHEEIADHFKHYYCIMIEKGYFESQYLLYEKTVPKFLWKPFAICHDVLKTLNLFAFEYEKHMPNAEITLDAQETILTHWLIRSILGESYDMRGISSEYEIARAQHYIEQHYGEKLTLKQLADLSNISVSSLSRGFKKELGLSPMDYLMQVRLEKAKQLLRRPERTVTEIALYCGFGSSAHFSDVFGKSYQLTPSQYRKNYQQD